MDAAQLVLIVCVVAFTVTAALCDVKTKKLPNSLTVPAFLAALVYHLASGALAGGWLGAGQGFLFALGGFGTGFGILLVLWMVGGGGGGDVKFMGALGAWLGAQHTLYVFVLGTLFVAFGALGILAWGTLSRGFGQTKRRYMTPNQAGQRHAGKRTAREGAALETKRREQRRLMPFGVPVALATWIVLIGTHLLADKL